jgi:hypothetical protein
LAILPNNIRFNNIKSKQPKFQQAVFVDLNKEQLHQLVEKYATGFYPHIVLSIEPTNTFSKATRKYSTQYTVIVFASSSIASIADVIAEFKKLLVYHKPKR